MSTPGDPRIAHGHGGQPDPGAVRTAIARLNDLDPVTSDAAEALAFLLCRVADADHDVSLQESACIEAILTALRGWRRTRRYSSRRSRSTARGSRTAPRGIGSAAPCGNGPRRRSWRPFSTYWFELRPRMAASPPLRPKSSVRSPPSSASLATRRTVISTRRTGTDRRADARRRSLSALPIACRSRQLSIRSDFQELSETSGATMS